MMIAPKLVVTRYAQLEAGDLCIFPDGDASFVALKVQKPDGDILVVPIGPRFPGGFEDPSLIDAPAATVLSFGKEYTLQLPTRPESWSFETPGPQTHCIVLTAEGAFLRVNFGLQGQGFRPCYIAMATGTIVQHRMEYIAPPGLKGFVLEWELLTNEAEPRRILAYPW
jgi:hypothetical protein